MKQWLGRIGGGGLAALAAVALAGGAIAYRLWHDPSPTRPATGAPADPLAELERRANADPGNAGAWQELGFAYFQQGRFADAATAYRRATGADANTSVLWSSLGEALVMASAHDPMPGEARTAFRKAAALDAGDPRARYFLAVDRDLTGDHEGAVADWLALLRETPEGAPWEADLKRTIEQVGKINAIAVDQRIAAALEHRPAPTMPAAPVMAGIAGPTQEQLAAATAIPPSEQQQMAESMVSRLAARLNGQPGDVDGWIKLMRSYQTLNRTSDARNALARAVAANPQQRAKLQQAAASLGIS
ncbi:MAG: tetratricopeptide repeat protein [Croceibacterium sp.]